MAIRVLVVDDEAMMAEVVEEALRATGFEVSVVHDGARALAEVEERPPDAVVLDVMMPGLDGREVCRRIRGNPDLDGLPIVLYSTMTEREVDWRGVEADAFHSKTANILDLPEILRRLVEK